MLKNPYVNAICAAAYIVGIVSLVNYFGRFADQPDTILAPMIMLSLLVISVSVMGLLFIYTPLKMLLGNERDAAIKFFGKTLGTFAGFALIFVILLFIFQ